ncbi:PREDICTED: putative F-box protein At4g38870 [Nicotiana attenuata]|uniref:putative F-box protein At4g38870 n=1 Tax=Nicotiana attenuata TaxID=49451 RepID=UPI000904906A|nr:PREDICTED: putative F-box protein At4g38870 [Nicotiana attenuata]
MASSNIIDLPNEVLVDILSRLAVKHVHQLQTVSKLWLRIISSPHFRRLYNKKSLNRPRPRVVQVSDYKHSPSGMEMISRTISISTMDKISVLRIILSLNTLSSSSPTSSFSITSYPSVSFDGAYIPSNNTYKIVHLYGTKTGPNYNSNYGGRPVEFRFETLTLRDGGPIPSSWQSLAHQEWFSYRVDSTCVNNAIYWLVGRADTTEKHIISMEIENEEFMSSVRCPKDPYYEEFPIIENGHLADLNGKLCLAYQSEELSRIDLYVLKDQKKQEWVKEHIIDLSGMGNWLKIMGYVQLKGNNGEIMIDGGKQPLLCNIEENRFRKLARSKMNIHIGLYFDRCFNLGSTRLSLQPRVDLLSEGDEL